MVPIPWLLLQRRPVAVARWRSASVSLTTEQTGHWREDRFDGVAHAVGAEGFDRVREAILTYTFFPPDRLTGTVDTAEGRLAPGATIVQRVRVGVMGFESGTRVIDVGEGSDEAGRRFVRFSYATLVGHPEAGIATFSASQTGAGDVELGIVTRSRASAWWARLGWPVTRALQLQTNRRVLDRLTAIARGEVAA